MAITSEEIELLCHINMEYFYLGTLISSDNIDTIEDVEKKLRCIKHGEDAVRNAKISEKKKEEFFNYFEKAKDILKGDIERFR